jgi:photosystem II stability/assembly factor-like uncharacterized protein
LPFYFCLFDIIFKKSHAMKNIFLLLAFCLLAVVSSPSQWIVVSTQGNTAVSFPSADIGYSTANGITKKTTNGGVNWSTLSGGNMTGIFFINNLTGWIVGYPGYIGRTTTGGGFIQQPTGIQDRLNDVFFIDENTGWVAGGDFGTERMFKTTNGGVNWIPVSSGLPNKMFSVYFINANTGWSVGGPSSPKIIKSTNGGNNWFQQSTTVNTPLYSVMFADSTTGWAVAGYLGGETIIKTTNGGNVWFSQSSGDTRYLRECYVRDPQTAFAVGQGGKLIWTTNGGTNWTIQQTGSSVELWSIDFANDTIGYAIGSTVVLKTTNGGITFVNNPSNEIPEKFVLYQNYPNPFNPVTDINFELPAAAYVTLTIFDISGRKLLDLVNEKQNAGYHKARWDASAYASGVYFYRIEARQTGSLTGDFARVKKMVLVK